LDGGGGWRAAQPPDFMSPEEETHEGQRNAAGASSAV
jgi:hypothetical protein